MKKCYPINLIKITKIENKKFASVQNKKEGFIGFIQNTNIIFLNLTLIS